MAEHYDISADHILGAPSPTPPPYEQGPGKKPNPLKAVLTWAALILGLGLALLIYAMAQPNGPTGAARIRNNCQFQYPYDKAAEAACEARRK